MAKLKEVLVKVKGDGPFPLDMLRHDNLAPYTHEDSELITRNNHVHDERTITLRGWWHGSEQFPTRVSKERWASFCWHVVEVIAEGRSIGGSLR